MNLMFLRVLNKWKLIYLIKSHLKDNQTKNDSSQQSNDSSVIFLKSQLRKKAESYNLKIEEEQTCSAKSSNQTSVRSYSDSKIIQKLNTPNHSVLCRKQ